MSNPQNNASNNLASMNFARQQTIDTARKLMTPRRVKDPKTGKMKTIKPTRTQISTAKKLIKSAGNMDKTIDNLALATDPESLKSKTKIEMTKHISGTVAGVSGQWAGTIGSGYGASAGASSAAQIVAAKNGSNKDNSSDSAKTSSESTIGNGLLPDSSSEKGSSTSDNGSSYKPSQRGDDNNLLIGGKASLNERNEV